MNVLIDTNVALDVLLGRGRSQNDPMKQSPAAPVHSRGYTGSLSSAKTPKTHACMRSGVFYSVNINRKSAGLITDTLESATF
jgi:hypothetical protein